MTYQEVKFVKFLLTFTKSVIKKVFQTRQIVLNFLTAARRYILALKTQCTTQTVFFEFDMPAVDSFYGEIRKVF